MCHFPKLHLFWDFFFLFFSLHLQHSLTKTNTINEGRCLLHRLGCGTSLASFSVSSSCINDTPVHVFRLNIQADLFLGSMGGYPLKYFLMSNGEKLCRILLLKHRDKCDHAWNGMHNKIFPP